MSSNLRPAIEEAISELEDLDELVIDLAITNEDGTTETLLFNTGEILKRREE